MATKRDPLTDPSKKPGDLRHGDTRADGRRFITYNWRSDLKRWVEVWASPLQWETRKQKRLMDYWVDPADDDEPPKHELKYWRANRPGHGDPDAIPLGYKHPSGFMFAGWKPDSGGWGPRWVRPSELRRVKAERKAPETRPSGFILKSRETMLDGNVMEIWGRPKFAAIEETAVGKLMRRVDGRSNRAKAVE